MIHLKNYIVENSLKVRKHNIYVIHVQIKGH